MSWCCPIFEGLAAFAGQRGLSVIVAKFVEDRFVLQSRAVDAGVILEFTDVPVTVAEEQVIFHCPGCGVSLADFYAGELEHLRREDLRLGASSS